MELSKNLQQIIDLIKALSVVELNSLVKAIEEEFGVSAAAMMVSGTAWTAGTAGDAGDAEGGWSSDIELTEAGWQKIAVIKVVKEILDIGLKEAKDMVGLAPVIIKKDVKDEAEIEAIKAKLEEAGATVTIK